jgi:hypothetical protein
MAGDHLVRIHAVLDVDDPSAPGLDGAVVLVMERAATNLRDVIDGSGQGQPVARVAELLASLASALTELHAKGWVHADVKPQNLLLMADGSLRLADFGLSAELDGTHAYVPIVGSTDYLPPEWWTEQMATRGVPVRPAGDIWAFGIVAHELLTGGQHPFPGATSRARSAAVREAAAAGTEPRVNPRLSGPWRDLVLDCLAYDPVDRTARTADLPARVRALGETPVVGDESPPRKGKRGVVAIGAVVLVAAVGVGVGWWLWPEPEPQPPGPWVAGQSQGTKAPRSGDLRPDAAVPAQYREVITSTARSCPDEAVTPALIAAMLSVESNFDPNAKSPETDEYGIAMWTPRLFEQWAPKRSGRKPSVYNATDSIEAMGSYLCAIGSRLVGLDKSDPKLRAAAYRTSSGAVVRDKGVPPSIRDYIAKVERKRLEFGVR